MKLKKRTGRPTAFTFRNALMDFDYVASDLVAEGAGSNQPFVTIAIPTFGRADLLAEAVRSALSQRFDRAYEILVVDNDPHSKDASTLLQRVAGLADKNFRYYVNSENIGMLPNWNRCIQLARGEWVTILNDDDLLDPDCLATLFKELDQDPSIDGIAGGKRHLDQRSETPPPLSVTRRLGKRLLLDVMFAGKSSRRIKPSKLFWGAITGNVGGFAFRKTRAIEVGGFYPEEYPSSDYWFYARFAQRCHLRQHRAVVSSTRIAVNESAKPVTIKGFMKQTYALQQTLAAGDAPHWWRHLSPLLIAHHRVEFRDFWGIDIPVAEVEEMLKTRLPGDHPYVLWAIRIGLGGF